MLRINAIKSAAHAADYYEKDDYYADGVSPSAWTGEGAKALGLDGPIDPDTFRSALEGNLPGVERQLGTERDGKWQHKPGWDATFSAPKSVSIMGEVAGDRRVIDAHERAVDQALQYMEREASVTRIHDRGANEVRHEVTKNLVVATFRHATSRAQDPQTHTHAIIMNATQRSDGAWRSLESKDLYQLQRTADAIYKAELASECRQLGYEIEITRDGFELREVPQAQRDHFSERTRQIDTWLKEKGYNPETVTREIVERAALSTRAAKQHTSMTELRNEWRADAKTLGFDAAAIAREVAARPVPDPEYLYGREREAVQRGMAHLSEREHVFTERELIRASLQYGLDKAATLSAVEHQIAVLKQNGTLRDRELEGLKAYTTREAVRLESEILQLADRLRGGEALLNRHEASQAVERAMPASHYPWTRDQREATSFLLSAPDRLVCVQGIAGSAKTTTVLKTVAAEYRARGYTVRAIAPYKDAAGVLGRGIGMEGITLARHLLDAKADRDMGGRQVWMVDEASLTSAKLARDLLKATDQYSANVILVGDERQHGSIESGRVFGQLQEYGVPTTKLEEIVRQRDENLKEGVYAASRGDVHTALDKVESSGSITSIEHPEKRQAAAAQQYLALPREERDSTLMLAASRDGRAEINTNVREGLKHDGTLQGKDQEVKVLTARDLTRTEKKIPSTYETGDVVRFGRDYKQAGIERDVYYRVAEANQEKNTVTLRSQDGQETSWRPDKTGAKTASVYREEPRQLAQGERLVWTRNDKQLGLNNGDRLEVVRADATGVQARKEDGREVCLDPVKDNHKHVDYAYCQTIASAQGKTADRVIVEMSSRSPLSTQRSVYVAISRARSEAHVVTDSKTELAHRAQERTGEKTAALDKDRTTSRESGQERTQEPSDSRDHGKQSDSRSR